MEKKAVRSWTPEQSSAIDTRDRTLLVSAAAGSGKTATLTERIIRSLTDKENPKNIASFLVVTFTRAAASELRAKITKALEEALSLDPENKELQRQLYMLPSAKIRTIDAFCNDILKMNTDAAGISPSYRLADKAEEQLLAKNILDGMIDALYASELPEVGTAEEFERLTDCLSESKRNEDVGDIFRLVYSKLESEIDGVKALLPLIEKLDPDKFTSVADSEYGERLLSSVGEMADHYLKIYTGFERAFLSPVGSEEKYLPMLYSDMELLKILASKNYSEIREALLNCQFEELSRVSKGRTVSMEEFKEFRSEAKKAITDYVKFFYYTEEMWRELFSGLYPLVKLFYRFLVRFDELFFEEKRRRSIFSYNDIARLAYGILIKDGKPTEIAESMKKQYTDVYIDEYQDVNPLQNAIFEAISGKRNRFMVGDIKQSIYVFRKAKPEIFASLKSLFPKITSGEESDAYSVFMSKNFRSDKAIIEFVNGIFDKIFGLLGDSIGYESSDRLENGKASGDIEYIKPDICVIDKKGTLGDNEPMVVALKIKDLLEKGRKNDGERITPKDIAILLRYTKGNDVLYAEALRSLKVPSVVMAKDEFFLTPEILLTLSLLNSIDNPNREIYLAGCMCSPLFGFGAEDIYEIKKKNKNKTLYDALVDYTDAHPEYEKGRTFLQRLEYYRTIAEGVGVDTLLYKLYHETGLLSLAAKNGGADNLILLYDYARGYEAGAFKGLYNFIHFINNLTGKKDTEFDDKRDGEQGDAVRIMTCHSSKGLEFPVVFLAESGTRIENKDSRNRLAFSDEMGIAFRLRTPSGLLPADNPIRSIINLHGKSKMYEEELRILYVALTRARERLFVVGTSPIADQEKYIEKCRMHRETLDAYTAKNLSSFLEIAATASDTEVIDQYTFLGDALPKEEEENQASESEIIPEKAVMGEYIDPDEVDELKNRFTYEYPRLSLTTLPEKLSVSKASPTVLDGADEHSISPFEIKDDDEKPRLPRFIEKNPADESAKRGIATHYLLQFCDLENLRDNGAENELKRLREGGFISASDAERVRVDEIELFRRSALFEKMLKAKKVYREFRFTVNIPASSMSEEQERIAALGEKGVLVQGVIDCILENPDGTLSLYDYKTDRLTKSELSDRSLAEETLRRKHSTQLSYYALAVKEIFGISPVDTEVYSLHLGDTVDVSIG